MEFEVEFPCPGRQRALWDPAYFPEVLLRKGKLYLWASFCVLQTPAVLYVESRRSSAAVTNPVEVEEVILGFGLGKTLLCGYQLRRPVFQVIAVCGKKVGEDL